MELKVLNKRIKNAITNVTIMDLVNEQYNEGTKYHQKIISKFKRQNWQTKMVELSSLGDANLPSLNEKEKIQNLLRCFIICKKKKKNVTVHFKKS